MIVKTKQKDIRKFANESPCMCFNLRKASRAITSVYDELFREVGITVTQGSILNSLRTLGPLSVSQLAEAMATDRTTLTRNLKPLERDGLVSIQVGKDKRAREISITAKGENTAQKAGRKWESFQEKLNATIGKERLEKLCQDLALTIELIQKV